MSVPEQAAVQQPQQDMKKPWVVLISFFVVGVAIAWGQNKIMPIIPVLMQQLGVTAQTAGWISSMSGVLGIVLALPTAGIVRKFGARNMGFAAIATSVIGAFIGLFSPNQAVLLLSRVIEGFGAGVIGVIAPSIISMWFPIEKRGLPMGIWSAWQVVALAGTYVFTGLILGPEVQWKNMYYVGLVLFVIAIVLFAVFVREPKEGEPNYADVTDDSLPLLSCLKSPSLYIIGIGGIGFGIAVGVFCAWMPTYWDQLGIMPLLQGNAYIGYIYIGEIFACIFGGVLLNKVKHRKKFAAVIGVLYAIVLFVAYHITTHAAAVAICFGYFLFEGIFVASMWTLVPQTVKDPRLVAGAVAVFTMFNNFGMMLGSPISGAILDATAMTGWGYLAIFAGVCQLIAAICFWGMKLYDANGKIADI